MSYPLYWFTLNGIQIPEWRVRKYIYDYYEGHHVQKIVWNYIINKAKAGNNFQQVIASDPDHPIHDIVRELQQEGYDCGGGIGLTHYGAHLVVDQYMKTPGV